MAKRQAAAQQVKYTAGEMAAYMSSLNKKLHTPYATWRETSEALGAEEQALAAAGVQFSGRCEKCFKVVPAVKLTLERLPFGRGEVWVCRGVSCISKEES